MVQPDPAKEFNQKNRMKIIIDMKKETKIEEKQSNLLKKRKMKGLAIKTTIMISNSFDDLDEIVSIPQNQLK